MNPVLLALAPMLLGGWVVMALLRLGATGSAAGPGFGWFCLYDILFVGLLPGALLFFMIRRAAPQRLNLSAWLVLVAGATFGALGAHLSCANDGPLHVLFWHILPVLVIGSLGVTLGRRLMRA